MNYLLYYPHKNYGGIYTYLIGLIIALKLDAKDIILVNENIEESIYFNLKNNTKAAIIKIPRTKRGPNIYIRFIANMYILYIFLKSEIKFKVIFVDWNIVLDFISFLFINNTISFVHTIPGKRLPNFLRIIFSYIAKKRKTQIVSVSMYLSNALKSKWFKKNTVIHEVVNHSSLKVGNNIRELNLQKKIIISTIAHCIEYKGVEQWLILAREIIKFNDNVYFHWIGDGPLYEKCIKETDQDSNIIFDGYRNDINDILRQTDIYVQLSKIENMSISVLDAMNYSIPCIVTDVGAMNELIIDGYNGVISNDFRYLVNQTKVLISNNKIYKEYCLNTKYYYEKKFSSRLWEETIKYIIKEKGD